MPFDSKNHEAGLGIKLQTFLMKIFSYRLRHPTGIQLQTKSFAKPEPSETCKKCSTWMSIGFTVTRTFPVMDVPETGFIWWRVDHESSPEVRNLRNLIWITVCIANIAVLTQHVNTAFKSLSCSTQFEVCYFDQKLLSSRDHQYSLRGCTRIAQTAEFVELSTHIFACVSETYSKSIPNWRRLLFKEVFLFYLPHTVTIPQEYLSKRGNKTFFDDTAYKLLSFFFYARAFFVSNFSFEPF